MCKLIEQSITETAVLHQLPGAVFVKRVLQNTSYYSWMNRFTANIMGYHDETELIGVAESEIPLLTSVAKDLNYYDQQIIAGDEATFLNVGQYAIPNVVALLIKKKPLRDSSGSIRSVLAIATPINSLVMKKMSLANLLENQPSQHHITVYQFLDDFPSLGLTKRESQCFYYLLRGKSAKEIAKILNIVNRTVESHTRNIKSKLGVHTRSQLYDFAFDKRLLHIVPLLHIPFYTESLPA